MCILIGAILLLASAILHGIAIASVTNGGTKTILQAWVDTADVGEPTGKIGLALVILGYAARYIVTGSKT
jgi:hypothetical protein